MLFFISQRSLTVASLNNIPPDATSLTLAVIPLYCLYIYNLRLRKLRSSCLYKGAIYSTNLKTETLLNSMHTWKGKRVSFWLGFQDAPRRRSSSMEGRSLGNAWRHASRPSRGESRYHSVVFTTPRVFLCQMCVSTEDHHHVIAVLELSGTCFRFATILRDNK